MRIFNDVRTVEKHDLRSRLDRARRHMLLAAAIVFAAHTGTAQVTSFKTIYSFKGGADGAAPHGGLILGGNGGLYGTTYTGGTGTLGTIFVLFSTGQSWEKAILHNFSGADGSLPAANLIFNSKGVLYGTTLQGGAANNGGTVFQLAPPSVAGGAWAETVVNSFSGSCGIEQPYGSLIIGPGGALFGTTAVSHCELGLLTGGSVFALTPPSPSGGSWTQHTLVNLWPSTGLGLMPFAGVISLGGSLYGTTYYSSSASGCGSVFQLSPPVTAGAAWVGTPIYDFEGGCGSEAALAAGPDGVLYGTTLDGGSGLPCSFPPSLVSGCGVVFQLTPPATPGGTWTETVIYNFTGVDGDGAYPSASVVVAKNGVLYGTTQYGGSATSGSPCVFYGAAGCGTVFQLNPPTAPGGTWTETVLHSFTGENGDGAIPMSGLTLSPTGMLFGTTSAGGAAGKGTLFAVAP